jgi:hypothetical protein
MNVLCDFHHTDLFRSLRALFEKRLGFRFYRPFGQDWWERGYFYHPEPAYGRGCLTQENFHKGQLRDFPAPSHYPHGMDALEWSWISLEEARQKIDVIVATLPANQAAFLKFQRQLRPKARLIRYLGNEEEYPGEEYPNLLCANYKVYRAIKGKYHAVFFHPEFDLALYRWEEPPVLEKPVIRTFLNYIYHGAPQSDRHLYALHKSRLQEKAFFYTHGLGTPPPGMSLEPGTPLWPRIRELYGADFRMPDLLTNDGEPAAHDEISALMRATNIAWHVKTADGYGYAIHQLYACGRPVICRRDNYEGKTAGLLLKDGETCVMLDGDTDQDIRKILYYLEPARNRRMCWKARKIFEKTVSFDEEAEKIRRFMETLR